MKLSDLLERSLGGPDPEIAGLASDSRDVKKGYLFAALSGVNADGRTFIADAVKRGAVAVLAQEGAEATVGTKAAYVAHPNPRLMLARIASRFFGRQPATVAAVTGTNGKTSIASFTRQIWTALGHKAASIGTVGIVTPKGEIPLSHTTPDPIEMHRILAQMADEGVTHLAIEASSHGLAQYRVDGIKIAAAGFTNLTRDHLDYHPTFEDYRAAKLRLFSAVTAPGGVAVVNTDGAHANDFVLAARAHGLTLVTVGEKGKTLKLKSRIAHLTGQDLVVTHGGRDYAVKLPLAGAFQAGNALVAAGFVIGLGGDAAKTFAALEHLRGARGRLELVATAKSGAPVFVDYAHTPDALETVLKALRPHTGGRLHVVFGCGGDRDPGKRPMMGEIAIRNADRVIVTDDNPRNEEPAKIRAAIMEAAKGAADIGDRAAAIREAVAGLKADDILVIAGKGHETYQIVGKETRHFDDAEEAREAVQA